MAAFKKGFCTHCKGDEKDRIFAVNKDADVCYCPHCTHAMKPKEAINNYVALISTYLKKASKALFESTEYMYAYETFAHIIDLDDTIQVAYLGRLLSLVYLSTLRTSKISLAMLMHRQQAKRYHYQETAREYFNFLWLLLDALDTYENRLRKRVRNHGVYYDIDCTILYLKRIDEIRNYKNFIADEASFFVDANKDQFSVIINRVRSSDEEYENIFKQRYVTQDGYSYLFVDFSKNGTPLINLQSHIPPQQVHRFKPASLYPKDNKKSQIRDDIYLNNLTLSRLVAMSVPFAIFLLVVVIGGMIASFVIDDKTIKLMIYIIGALLLSASFLMIILHFAWKRRLKKKYYNGTNPFIFR